MKTKLLSLLLTAAFGQAFAAPVTFSNYADFAKGASNISTVDFEGITSSSNVAFLQEGQSIGGLNFTSNTPYSAGDFAVVSAGYAAGAFSLGTGAVLLRNRLNAPIDIALNRPSNAFGLNLGNYQNRTSTYTVTLSDGKAFSIDASATGNTFFGVLLDTSITSFAITSAAVSSNFALIVDNITLATRVAQANDVPEPASLALVGLGLAGIAAARKRKSV